MMSRSAVAAPAQSISELRAIICCAEHCPKDAPRVPMTPRRCCVVDGAAADPASTSPAASLASPAPVLVAVLATPVPSPVLAAIEAAPGVRLRAGPLRHLRTIQIRC